MQLPGPQVGPGVYLNAAFIQGNRVPFYTIDSTLSTL